MQTSFGSACSTKLAHIALGHVGQPNGTSEDDEKAADKWSELLH